MSFKTIADVRAANKAAGSHWFERSTMRFFGSRIESGLYAGRYFVTSEKPPHAPRAYSVREAEPSGDVGTVGAFCGYAYLEDAREAARNLAREVRK